MIQAIIFVLTLFSIFLLSGKKNSHWGFVISLVAQPFWFYSSWQTSSWGVFGLAACYSVLNIRGIRNRWEKFK